MFSQSSLGVCLLEVMISTWSPFCSLWFSGTSLWLTFAPIQLAPTSVWISNAKSSAVALKGNCINAPFGVKIKISSEKRFILKSSRKSSALESGFLSISLTFCTHWSKPLSVDDSLYFQCAANPFSAISFIRLVRICTSTHCPRGPITVVCSDS